MKKLQIKIFDQYKVYKKDTEYCLEGDLIILSGINGSGKSQLLQIIAKNVKNKLEREVTVISEDGSATLTENIMMLSFRDNINLGEDFGQFSVTYHKYYASRAWEFYNSAIKHNSNSIANERRKKKFNEGTIFLDNNGIKNSSWRSIIQLSELLKAKYKDDKIFNLSQQELETLLPADFVWRDENDIIQQVGNIFYIACCDRVNQQIKCSSSEAVFNNDKWLENAPWTILNQLFERLRFKYRFKNDYEFRTPNMEENPKLRDDEEIRSLLDLSDGEKAILKLALIALDEEISKDIEVMLFDEYDAPLNPSLVEAFYYVIEKFYVKKGIQVIITTHSPATISLAPEYSKFYEIFSKEDASPQIVEVSQYEYEELKKANKSFYDKIKNQEDRISELEKSVNISGNKVFVEDRYDQIYKIAYLKLNDIEDITEENFEEKFNANCNFSIHGNYSCGGLYSQLICTNITNEKDCKIICLFDFDGEGYRKFEDLQRKKENDSKLFDVKQGTVEEGLYIKHSKATRYALMLPIPERLRVYVSEKTSSDCFVEVETLLSEDYLKTNSKAEQRSAVLPFYKMKDNHKKSFWKDLLVADKSHFEDFRPLFRQIEKIFSER